jgi:signal transduction histidine kinase
MIREYLELISNELRYSGKIISELLDFARINSANKEELRVSELVAQVLKKHAPPQGIQVTTRIPCDLPLVSADPMQMEQVLTNRIINAYQAMSEGGKLTIRAKAENSKVAVSVADTGCGIPDEHQKKLFELLFTTKAQGIGLGLAISKNLVEANKGTIEVESEKGKGSTFII